MIIIDFKLVVDFLQSDVMAQNQRVDIFKRISNTVKSTKMSSVWNKSLLISRQNL